jgi:hypothetical protein
LLSQIERATVIARHGAERAVLICCDQSAASGDGSEFIAGLEGIEKTTGGMWPTHSEFLKGMRSGDKTRADDAFELGI